MKSLNVGLLSTFQSWVQTTQFQVLVSKTQLNEFVPSSKEYFSAARKDALEIKFFLYTTQSCLKDPFHRFIGTNCVCIEGLSIQCTIQ